VSPGGKALGAPAFTDRLAARTLPPPGWCGPLSRSRRRGPRSNRPQEVHLHLHGVSAEDIAAILARRDQCHAHLTPRHLAPAAKMACRSAWVSP
jgi:hypothetical protein